MRPTTPGPSPLPSDAPDGAVTGPARRSVLRGRTALAAVGGLTPTRCADQLRADTPAAGCGSRARTGALLALSSLRVHRLATIGAPRSSRKAGT